MRNNKLSIGVPLKVHSLAALSMAALAGCASTPASTADPQEYRNSRNASPPSTQEKTAAAAPAVVPTAPVQAASAATTLDACDRRISGEINRNLRIIVWESREKPGGRNFEKILENIRTMERTSIQMNCRVIDAGKSVYPYEKAIDFVMEHARKESVLKDIYDFEFHQIAIAVKSGGNQMTLDGNLGNFRAEAAKFVQPMFKMIIRRRKEYQQSQDAVDSANRTLVGAMAGVASYFLIAKALGHILPEVPYSSSSTSGSVAPASAPTWTIVNKKSYFEVKCSNKSFTYSVSACGNMGLFDNKGYYREGMGGCHYKSVEHAARELCTR